MRLSWGKYQTGFLLLSPSIRMMVVFTVTWFVDRYVLPPLPMAGLYRMPIFKLHLMRWRIMFLMMSLGKMVFHRYRILLMLMCNLLFQI
ncbi:hypothetical protein [Pseudomonas cichorii]|uniref:hypothetical protein n=1 Tax=Pseudomonas cichorii TaxID=36746 RepID=UPI001910D243|nr:hypothetical protein [Pseudomonas cichorii]